MYSFYLSVGILIAITTLLELSFEPTRTVLLAFGFDEEISGQFGARTLAEYMLSNFGENAFSLLVDEGGSFRCLFCLFVI